MTARKRQGKGAAKAAPSPYVDADMVETWVENVEGLAHLLDKAAEDDQSVGPETLRFLSTSLRAQMEGIRRELPDRNGGAS